jgi:hypothetical protein
MMATFKYTKLSQSVKAGLCVVPANFVVSIRPYCNIHSMSYLV